LKPPIIERGKLYHGHRNERGNAYVWALPWKGDAYPLPVCLEIRNHSPTGFEWGYFGSGPAQLALALLVDALDGWSPAAAIDSPLCVLDVYQDFKEDVVAKLAPEWELTQATICTWFAARLRKEGGAR